MSSRRLKAFLLASFTGLAMASFGPAGLVQAGPISEMLARHRQAKQMKLPAMDKPFSMKPIKDPNAKTASLSNRFKQRFSLKRGGVASGKDDGVVKTSR